MGCFMHPTVGANRTGPSPGCAAGRGAGTAAGMAQRRCRQVPYPYPNYWFTHNHVSVFVVWRHDEPWSGMQRRYWYGTDPTVRDDGNGPSPAFDVRELPPVPGADVETEAGRRAIICAAIDAGLLP